MTLPTSYFDELYARNADPWNFEFKPYEHAKYDATLAALPRERFASAWEIGCSIGVLTQRLAARCDALLSVDASELPLRRARERCADLPHITFQQMRLPDELPDARFDLILLSEVGYYLSRPDLERAIVAITERLKSNGALVLVHYLPRVPDYPLSGDEVHDAFLAWPHGLQHTKSARAERYRLDALEKS